MWTAPASGTEGYLFPLRCNTAFRRGLDESVKNLHCSGMCSLFTYLLTPRNRVALEKLTGLQLVKKLPAFYGTRRFITAFTSVRQLSLSWAVPKYHSRSETVSVNISWQITFGQAGVVSTSPNPTSWRTTLCRLSATAYIRSYPPYWRPFLHPQLEDAPCRGDKDSLITWHGCFHVAILPLILGLLFQYARSPSINPSAWSDGHCPHAARSHSFVYISTS